MDFHNIRSMPRGTALFLGLAAPLPALVALVVYLVVPGVFAANLQWLLAALAAGTCLYGGALGWWMGRCIEGPLVRWGEIAEKVHITNQWLDDLVYTNHKGALGKLARQALIIRDRLADRAQEAKTNAAAAAAALEARRAQEEAAEAKSREQARVVSVLAAGLSQLADGNLTHRVDEQFPADYQQLKHDFNGAMERLHDAMGALTISVSGVRSSTEEISRSAEDLSRRTESQAANLEETAAALDQITHTVRRTADGAAGAKAVALTATNEAQQSEKVVRDAVNAMSEIERSAQQISQIIGVIDEIAFQTNLLALNAGVEAARAGEAGRGFAVVASEVRALAQRSASAAKEIKALISTSTGQVTCGVQLVDQTGQALARILTKVAEINVLVGDIAGSAEEQALGLHEVNSAINQMDHGTQQNAAMVQESTAACVALAQEAHKLSEMIGRFELGDEVGSRIETPPRPVASPARALRRRAMQAFAGPAAAQSASNGDDDWEEF